MILYWIFKFSHNFKNIPAHILHKFSKVYLFQYAHKWYNLNQSYIKELVPLESYKNIDIVITKKKNYKLYYACAYWKSYNFEKCMYVHPENFSPQSKVIQLK